MKKQLFSILALLAGICTFAQTPASSSLISYTGRIQKDGESVSFDWSGTMVHVVFNGTSLSMNCSDTKCNYFNVWTDRTPGVREDKVVRTEGECCVILCSGLKKGTHEVYLQKRSEGEQGVVTISSFVTDGTILKAKDSHKRHIEFIGDSYTCGYGTEGADRDQPFRCREENCNLAYAAIIGRFFDASINLVSHSGKGIVRNYNDEGQGSTMVTKYGRVFDTDGGPAWSPDMADYRPDIVVIYLGTNDFSTGKQPQLNAWCGEYAKLLRQVRSFYGDKVPVLCVASRADELLGSYVEEAVRRSGVAGVEWTSIQNAAHNDTSELGSSWHPNYEGHRKVASCMIPYISTLTGWDMPFKAVE